MLSCFSHVPLFAAPQTAVPQAPLSVGFSRQEYWSGLPCPPAGNLLDPGFKPSSLAFLAWAGCFFTTSTTWEPMVAKQVPGAWVSGELQDQLCQQLLSSQFLQLFWLPFDICLIVPSSPLPNFPMNCADSV